MEVEVLVEEECGLAAEGVEVLVLLGVVGFGFVFGGVFIREIKPMFNKLL